MSARSLLAQVLPANVAPSMHEPKGVFNNVHHE
jgi:hypothetical protein